jgi:hypothetical protein
MIGRSRKNRFIVDGEGSATHWLTIASTALHPVMDAEHRLSASLKMSGATMLAAADELGAASRDATAWIAENACPDIELRDRVAQMQNTCAEAALTAQRAITDPPADTNAVNRRLGYLLRIIDLQCRAVDDW